MAGSAKGLCKARAKAAHLKERTKMPGITSIWCKKTSQSGQNDLKHTKTMMISDD